MTTEEKRAARRAAMPIVTAFVEHYERLGLNPRVVCAEENGVVVGKEPQYTEVFTIPKGYRKPIETKENRNGRR